MPRDQTKPVLAESGCLRIARAGTTNRGSPEHRSSAVSQRRNVRHIFFEKLGVHSERSEPRNAREAANQRPAALRETAANAGFLDPTSVAR